MTQLANATVEQIQAQIQEAVALERQRCVDLCNYAREEGETDLRQVRHWIESGADAAKLAEDSDG